MLNLKSLHHVGIGSPALLESEKFANDFGLVTVERRAQTIYLRTNGPAAYNYVVEPASAPSLKSIGFVVDSLEDLHRAVGEHGASAIRELNAPGGGLAVSLVDPSGITFDLMHGVAEVPAVPPSETRAVNTGVSKERKGESQLVPPLRPAELLKLGHVGLFINDFDGSAAWYESVLGLVASEMMYMSDPKNRLGAFYRLNRGAQYTEHHTLAVFKSDRSDCHHISFEVHDLNEQYRAHRWMLKRGWEPIWGVGRHPHGSHIFDLWRDPNRFRFETYTDTDLLTSERPVAHHDVLDSVVDLWSDQSPEAYFK